MVSINSIYAAIVQFFSIQDHWLSTIGKISFALSFALLIHQLTQWIYPNLKKQMRTETSTAHQTSVLGITGLFNLQNTCYINSSIQCLVPIVPLNRYFLSNEYRKQLRFRETPSNGLISIAFASLLGQIWSQRSSPIVPNGFIGTFTRYVTKYLNEDQHDNMEFFGDLLDQLHEELKQPVSQETSAPTSEAVSVSSRRQERSTGSTYSSIVTELFGSDQVTFTKCPLPGCGAISESKEPLLYLSLPLPPATKAWKVISTSPILQVPPRRLLELISASSSKQQSVIDPWLLRAVSALAPVSYTHVVTKSPCSVSLIRQAVLFSYFFGLVRIMRASCPLNRLNDPRRSGSIAAEAIGRSDATVKRKEKKFNNNMKSPLSGQTSSETEECCCLPAQMPSALASYVAGLIASEDGFAAHLSDSRHIPSNFHPFSQENNDPTHQNNSADVFKSSSTATPSLIERIAESSDPRASQLLKFIVSQLVDVDLFTIRNGDFSSRPVDSDSSRDIDADVRSKGTSNNENSNSPSSSVLTPVSTGSVSNIAGGSVSPTGSSVESGLSKRYSNITCSPDISSLSNSSDSSLPSSKMASNDVWDMLDAGFEVGSPGLVAYLRPITPSEGNDLTYTIPVRHSLSMLSAGSGALSRLLQLPAGFRNDAIREKVVRFMGNEARPTLSSDEMSVESELRDLGLLDLENEVKLSGLSDTDLSFLESLGDTNDSVIINEEIEKEQNRQYFENFFEEESLIPPSSLPFVLTLHSGTTSADLVALSHHWGYVSLTGKFHPSVASAISTIQECQQAIGAVVDVFRQSVNAYSLESCGVTSFGDPLPLIQPPIFNEPSIVDKVTQNCMDLLSIEWVPPSVENRCTFCCRSFTEHLPPKVSRSSSVVDPSDLLIPVSSKLDDGSSESSGLDTFNAGRGKVSNSMPLKNRGSKGNRLKNQMSPSDTINTFGTQYINKQGLESHGMEASPIFECQREPLPLDLLGAMPRSITLRWGSFASAMTTISSPLHQKALRSQIEANIASNKHIKSDQIAGMMLPSPDPYSATPKRQSMPVNSTLIATVAAELSKATPSHPVKLHWPQYDVETVMLERFYGLGRPFAAFNKFLAARRNNLLSQVLEFLHHNKLSKKLLVDHIAKLRQLKSSKGSGGSFGSKSASKISIDIDSILKNTGDPESLSSLKLSLPDPFLFLPAIFVNSSLNGKTFFPVTVPLSLPLLFLDSSALCGSSPLHQSRKGATGEDSPSLSNNPFMVSVVGERPVLLTKSTLSTGLMRPDASKISIYSCLNLYTEPSVLSEDNKCTCTICHSHVRATRWTAFRHLAPVLVLALKRFVPINDYGATEKVEASVDFPLEGLNMRDYSQSAGVVSKSVLKSASSAASLRSSSSKGGINDSSEDSEFIYDLVGVSCHSGHLDVGHYVSLIRSPVTGLWYLINDDIATPLIPNPRKFFSTDERYKQDGVSNGTLDISGGYSCMEDFFGSETAEKYIPLEEVYTVEEIAELKKKIVNTSAYVLYYQKRKDHNYH